MWDRCLFLQPGAAGGSAGGVGMGAGGVGSCWRRPLSTAACTKLGSLSSSSGQECASLAQLLFPASPHSVIPSPVKENEQDGHLHLVLWGLCELLPMGWAGIPSWSSFVNQRMSKGHARAVLVPEQCLCHPKSWWLHSRALQQQQHSCGCQLPPFLALEGK